MPSRGGGLISSGTTVATTIQAIGDSLTTQGYCQPNVLPPAAAATIPAWAPNTAFATNSCCSNNGFIYYATTGGTTGSSGGPTTVGTGITDGSVVWAIRYPFVAKWNTNFLAWVCRYSQGALNWDMSDGYQQVFNGLLKVIVTNGGSGYTNQTTLTMGGSVSANTGVKMAPVITNGVITGVTVLNPGSYSGFGTVVATDPGGGSGATFSPVAQVAGTYGVPGCQTADAVARLPDAIASKADIMCVWVGVNDIAAASDAVIQSGALFASITAGLRTLWEGLAAAGKKVVAFTYYPESRFTPYQITLMVRLNRWIRSYFLKRSFTTGAVGGPFAGTSMVLVDVEGYATNGASSTDSYILTDSYDGTHESPKFASYLGGEVNTAITPWISPTRGYTRRGYTDYNDGYDPLLNPGGNLLEGIPWKANTVYQAGQRCSANGIVAHCTQGGTSASSGSGPTNGTNIADGTCIWSTCYEFAGTSLFAAGTGGTLQAATGITYSGNLAQGYTLQRTVGSASGTVACAIESPWSNNQPGQRQVISWSLGGGTANEQWNLVCMYQGASILGVQASDLTSGNFWLQAEMEIELSGAANIGGMVLELYDNTTYLAYQEGLQAIAGSTGNAYPLVGAAGTEPFPLYNGGRMWLRTEPYLITPKLGNIDLNFGFTFDTSGAAGSSTLTLKINQVAVRRANIG